MLSNREELKNRIKAKQRDLEARFEELKADSRDGWDNMSDRVSRRLNDWLKD